MNLRHLTFKVRPAVEHPKYYDWQFGFLSIWLFGSSDDDARERAEQILKQLPYETVGEVVSIRDHPEPKAGGRPEFLEREERARQIGLALLLDACVPGADEEVFEASEPP